MSNPVSSVAEAIKSFFDFSNTRAKKAKERYEIKRDKDKEKALNYAEKGFKVSLEGYNYLFLTVFPFLEKMIVKDTSITTGEKAKRKTFEHLYEKMEDYKKDVEKLSKKFDKKD